jgi:hypothetical protein
MTLRKPLFMNGTEGFSEEMASADSLQLGGLTMSGNIAMGGFNITGMADPVNPGDAATKSYVDATAQGLSPRLPVAAVAVANVASLSGTTTIDDVALIDGDRVLLTNQTTASQNGIWVVHAGAWTRPTDFATGAHAARAFTFVVSGTTYSGSGWTCTTAAPNDVIDTNNLAWVQFSSAGVILAGSGLTKVGNTISVKKGDGIETTSNSNATNIDLDTNPGLVLNGTSPNKKLAALPDPNGGVQINGASGLSVKLNGTTLQVGGSGLSVKGLPSLFEVNGSAVDANVTAVNINTLVDGGNADALHSHAAASATSTPKVENDLPVNEAVLVGDPVYYTNTNNRVGRGDTVDSKAKIIGVSRTAQAVVGNTAKVVSIGPASGVLSGANAGDAYYLATGGGLSNGLPGAAKRVIRCGIAMNGTDLFVALVDYGKKAA